MVVGVSTDCRKKPRLWKVGQVQEEEAETVQSTKQVRLVDRAGPAGGVLRAIVCAW